METAPIPKPSDSDIRRRSDAKRKAELERLIKQANEEIDLISKRTLRRLLHNVADDCREALKKTDTARIIPRTEGA